MVRNPLTRKHGDLIDVIEIAKAFTFEAGPNVCYKNLSSLVKADCAVIKSMPVVETREIIDDKINESG